MCKLCAQTVREMDIRETDLPYLPFTPAKWYCIVPGCKGGAKVRDYGIAPLYYWPVRVTYQEVGWRGGWFDVSSHCYMCSRHYRLYKARQMPQVDRSEAVCITKIKTAIADKKKLP